MKHKANDNNQLDYNNIFFILVWKTFEQKHISVPFSCISKVRLSVLFEFAFTCSMNMGRKDAREKFKMKMISFMFDQQRSLLAGDVSKTR